MGVEFYSCDCCNNSKYEEYVGHCNNCWSNICTSCLVNNDIKSNYAHSYGYQFDSNNPKLMSLYEAEGFNLYDEENNPIYEDGEIIDDSNIDSKYCPFCSGEAINKENLLEYILKKYNLDEKKEWDECKKQGN
jgi:hypothetical protein